ncbi:uncharacterized protein LOC129612383 [Condylostylus longicornis]|uniref:uncharacterized protein LOC129612383 n=1 Tax=Condylostylus longicornis TaxID=2530218 RepID=UPI00244E2157|nr:uncharacterized protein LOC129612383 [Condylostylus longicornis]
MKYLALIFVISISVQIINCAEIDLNDYNSLNLSDPCDVKGSNFNECIRNYLQKLWHTIANPYGIEKLHLPPLDPFVLNERKWPFRNDLFDFVFYTNNLKIINMNQTTIHKSKMKFFDTNKFSLELDMSDPEVIIDSDFKLNLIMSDLKIKHKGRFNLKVSQIHNYVKVTGTLDKRNGYHYLRPKTVNFKANIKDFKFVVKSDESNESNAILDNLISNLFTNNLKEIYKSFVVETRPLWEPIILDISGNFFKNFPGELMCTNLD